MFYPTPGIDTETLGKMACTGPEPLGWMLPGDPSPHLLYGPLVSPHCLGRGGCHS